MQDQSTLAEPLRSSEVTSAWDVETTLGEGPVWVDGALWFVDIKKQKIHRYGPEYGSKQSWACPEQVGFLLPEAGGAFVAGLQSGLYRFEPDDGSFSLIAEVEPELPGNRLNDGVVDNEGRLWFGSMDNGEAGASGRFYSYHKGKLQDSGVPPVAITNGPAISADGGTLYWVDTRGRTIHAAELRSNGTLGGSRLFATIEDGGGSPDGPTVDSENCLWVGLYSGWEARRYSPAGEIIDRVRFPVANITKIAFGGDDLRTVYATTARHLLEPQALAHQPLAGALFEFRTEVPGLPSRRAEI